MYTYTRSSCLGNCSLLLFIAVYFGRVEGAISYWAILISYMTERKEILRIYTQQCQDG